MYKVILEFWVQEMFPAEGAVLHADSVPFDTRAQAEAYAELCRQNGKYEKIEIVEGNGLQSPEK
jgi:hypothetical protein